MKLHPADLEAVGALWANAEKCRAALRALARAVAPYGVQLLAMKGVHIAFTLAPAPWERPMADADALAVTGDVDRAVGALCGSDGRWRLAKRDAVALTLLSLDTGGFVDLHRRALPRGMGRLSNATLRARAKRAPVSLGTELLVPDSTDAAVLAIAHGLKDGLRDRLAPLARDLRWLKERGGVSREGLAARLGESGLRRVGLVVLNALAEGDPAWTPWLEAIAPASWERLWATSHAFALSRARSRAVSYFLRRVVADSPQGVLIGLSLGLIERTWERWRHPIAGWQLSKGFETPLALPEESQRSDRASA